jgi:hypothetical protein
MVVTRITFSIVTINYFTIRPKSNRYLIFKLRFESDTNTNILRGIAGGFSIALSKTLKTELLPVTLVRV